MAVQGKAYDPYMLDYQMSKEFGTNWRDMEYRRARAFIAIMGIENREKSKKVNKKSNGIPNPVNPRNARKRK